MTAPAPSPAEQAVIDRFGIFEPEARVVEEVARAIYDKGAYCGDCPYDGWDSCPECRRYVRGYAVAAVAGYRAAQDGDLHTRMADVADNLDYYAGKTDGGTHAGGLTDAAGQIRDALTAAQDGGAEDLPWCNLPICPESREGSHRITAGRCMVVPAPSTQDGGAER